MSRKILFATIGLALLSLNFASAETLKQTAYLKASNPAANYHFGNGGAL